MKKILILPLLIFSFGAHAQLTLENIWNSREFSAKFVPGLQSMADGKSYCKLDQNADKTYACNRYDMASGEKTGLIFSTDKILVDGKPIAIENFTFSADEKKVVITNGYEAVYRHSGKSNTYLYNITTGTVTRISNKKIMYAILSPDGSKMAYVSDNNLYCYDIAKAKEIQLTKDGKKNAIINGAVDWVYEEEFTMSRGFEWSPDGQSLAYYRFDESRVPEFTMDIFGSLYPQHETWKYPKAGQPNSIVDVYICKIGKKPVKCITGSENDQYLPRIKWASSQMLSIQRLNRHQNKLEVLLSDNKGKTSIVYTETNQYYVDVHDIAFESTTQGAKSFYTMLFLSEKSGYNHLYKRTFTSENGKIADEQETQITKGNWEIDQYLGNKNGKAYFTSGMNNPADRQLYSTDMSTGELKQLTNEPGSHSISFSASFEYFTDNYSTMTTAPITVIKNNNGAVIRTLETNDALNKKLQGMSLGAVEFSSFTSSENVKLDYWKINPPNFDPNKKYPVLFFVYGGPGHQTVRNQWGGANYMWYQYMAAKGYIIISVDNRGSGGRGEAFKKMTYLQLGKYETMDYIDAAKYFGSQSYVDKNRIGIFGWSYGGFMASSCITKGADYFKTAVAVAPVTNWRYYDNIYTERYMRTPAENEKGYDDNSPINHVDKIKGNYLIIHGTADDNVHFQNAAEMVKAMNEKNIPYDAEYYPNTNHGIRGGKIRLHLFSKISTYLENNL